MSHSSGIPVGATLKEKFGSAVKDTSIRALQVEIEETEIVCLASKNKVGTFEEDLKWIGDLFQVDKATYVIVRLDGDASKFVLFCYVPDKSKVREKMLYASTRSNLKQQLGASYFVDEVFGTIPDDFSSKGYKTHKDTQKMEAPLTDSERLKQTQMESGEIYTGGASTYVHGVAFPVDQKAMDAVTQLKQGSVNYVQIAIDLDGEKVILDHTEKSLDLSGVKAKISTSEPRFHFFAFKHSYEGAEQSPVVYIYSCPDGSGNTKSAPVKMRMLYSSSKANVAEILSKVGGSVAAKMEINTSDELEEEAILTLLHPKQEEKKESFAKPSRNVKGPRRLIK